MQHRAVVQQCLTVFAPPLSKFGGLAVQLMSLSGALGSPNLQGGHRFAYLAASSLDLSEAAIGPRVRRIRFQHSAQHLLGFAKLSFPRQGLNQQIQEIAARRRQRESRAIVSRCRSPVPLSRLNLAHLCLTVRIFGIGLYRSKAPFDCLLRLALGQAHLRKNGESDDILRVLRKRGLKLSCGFRCLSLAPEGPPVFRASRDVVLSGRKQLGVYCRGFVVFAGRRQQPRHLKLERRRGCEPCLDRGLKGLQSRARPSQLVGHLTEQDQRAFVRISEI